MRWAITAAALLCACASRPSASQAGTRYFGTFRGYDLPLRLDAEITKEHAAALPAYCVADVGPSGEIVRVTKMLYGKADYTHEYTYDAAGRLEEARVANASGKVSVFGRSRSGKLVQR